MSWLLQIVLLCTLGCIYLRPGVGLLDHMVVLFLHFKGIHILFSIVAAPVYIPTNSVGGLLYGKYS